MRQKSGTILQETLQTEEAMRQGEEKVRQEKKKKNSMA
jgi:hypothetical protein